MRAGGDLLTADILRAIDDFGYAMQEHQPVAGPLRHTLYAVINRALERVAEDRRGLTGEQKP